MKYRTLGRRGDQVSILGFGCMRLPIRNGNYGDIDEVEAGMQIRYAIDHGVNYIDTAYGYHDENSEGFVGRILKEGYREKVFLATKMPSWLIQSREDLDKYLNIQLERLQTDHIDFYLLHTLNEGFWDNYLKCDIFDFITKAKTSGKIRQIGFSFHDRYDVFERIINSYDWDFCQIQLNYFDEEYQAGLKGMRLAGEKGIGVIVMEPLRGGRLAEQRIPEIQAIWAKADEPHSSAGWALRYVWNYSEVKTVLSGMNNLDHIKENLHEADNAEIEMLSKKDKQLINDVKNIYKSRVRITCTNCRYCMPCPFGVNIPANFSYANGVYIFNEVEYYKRLYHNQMKQDEMANICRKCGLCETKCPQNIPIVKELENVWTLLGK